MRCDDSLKEIPDLAILYSEDGDIVKSLKQHDRA
jgi:hypothetical protein